jgi:L-glyceraldehyde reductase
MYVPGFLSPGLAGSSSKFSPSGSITNLHAIISYRNQKEIANGIQKAYKDIPGLKREDLFIV